MHPGNVFVGGDGGMVLLDMGFVARLSPADKQAFTDFFFGLVNGRGADCAQIVVDGASAFGPRYDAPAFEAAIVELVGRHARLRSADFEIAAFVKELFDCQRRFDVRGSTAFITTVLAMVVYDGICKRLYPECDFQAEARGFLIVQRYAAAG
jgi:ubiquinone biosynthesis protein